MSGGGAGGFFGAACTANLRHSVHIRFGCLKHACMIVVSELGPRNDVCFHSAFVVIAETPEDFLPQADSCLSRVQHTLQHIWLLDDWVE